MSDEEQVLAVVESWREAFEAGNVEALKALWAQSLPGLTYLATESKVQFTSFPQISDYYDQLCAAVRLKEWRTWDVAVDLMSSDVAFVYGFTSMLFVPRNAEAPDDGYWQGRIAFTLIKRDGEWKIAHYEDSTLLQYLLPAVAQVQKPLIERCIALVTAGQTDQCLPILQDLLRPLTLGTLARAAQPRDMSPRAPRKSTPHA